MSFLLSELDPSLHLMQERPVDCFTRIDTHVSENRCVFVANEKYLQSLDASVKMVITTAGIAQKIADMGLDCGVCVCESPRDTYFALLIRYEKSAALHFAPTRVGMNCTISPRASVAGEGVTIGDRVVIGDFACILPGTVIGSDVVIQPGAVIGAQLFNVCRQNRKQIQIPQNGQTVIEDNVLVGASSVVARAMYTYGVTRIGEGTKIDAGTSISHNDVIGRECMICAGAVLGGYVDVGEGTEIGMGATVKNAVRIGKNVVIGMGSAILFPVNDNETWFGNPARRIK